MKTIYGEAKNDNCNVTLNSLYDLKMVLNSISYS